MNTNTNPRTATEALAQANRFDRAKQIIKEGYTFENMGEGYGIAVSKPGTTAAAYWMFGPFCETGCSCPDFEKNGNRCKHMLAWSILQDEAAETKSLFDEDVRLMEAAMCAQYEREAE